MQARSGRSFHGYALVAAMLAIVLGSVRREATYGDILLVAGLIGYAVVIARWVRRLAADARRTRARPTRGPG